MLSLYYNMRRGVYGLADVQKADGATDHAKVGEDLLRQTIRRGDDPFLALCQSYKPKSVDDKWLPSRMEDDEDR